MCINMYICLFILFIYSISQQFSIFRALDKLNITLSFTFLFSLISLPSISVFSLNKIMFITGKIPFVFTVYSGNRNCLINATFALIQASLQTVSLQTSFTMFILRSIAPTYFGHAFWPSWGSYKCDRHVQHILQLLMDDWPTTYTYFYSMEQCPSWEANRPQLVKKLPAFYGTRRFSTAFTSTRHLSPSWAILTRLYIYIVKYNDDCHYIIGQYINR